MKNYQMIYITLLLSLFFLVSCSKAPNTPKLDIYDGYVLEKNPTNENETCIGEWGTEEKGFKARIVGYYNILTKNEFCIIEFQNVSTENKYLLLSNKSYKSNRHVIQHIDPPTSQWQYGGHGGLGMYEKDNYAPVLIKSKSSVWVIFRYLSLFLGQPSWANTKQFRYHIDKPFFIKEYPQLITEKIDMELTITTKPVIIDVNNKEINESIGPKLTIQKQK